MQVYDARLRAQKVLGMIRKHLKGIGGKDVSAAIGSYNNGREQGVGLWVSDRTNRIMSKEFLILWAENRTSDDMVVYAGEPDFMERFSITDEMYEDRKLYRNEKQAARAILAILRRFLK